MIHGHDLNFFSLLNVFLDKLSAHKKCQCTELKEGMRHQATTQRNAEDQARQTCNWLKTASPQTRSFLPPLYDTASGMDLFGCRK